MFKRTRKGAGQPAFAPSEPVPLDRWYGDPRARDLRAALEAGDTDTLAAEYERSDAHRREFLVSAVTRDLPGLVSIGSWADARPDGALPLLLRGAQQIATAWEARGSGYATTVDPEAWDVFHHRLRGAEDDLRRSAALADDGVAWSFLLTTARGLQLPKDELRRRYSTAVERSPGLAYAADQMLQALCLKWSGSHEEMFAFARETAAAAPDDDPRHRLVAIAHVERALAFRDAEDADALEAYRRDPAVADEIVERARRSVLRPSFGRTPQHTLTLNWFAFALGYFHRAKVARPVFVRIGSSPTTWPWCLLPTNGPKLFSSYQRLSRIPA